MLNISEQIINAFIHQCQFYSNGKCFDGIHKDRICDQKCERCKNFIKEIQNI